MQTVRVTKVLPVWDMRMKHKLRKRHITLANGEVLVAFNRSKKMARIIDVVGAVHDYYAPRGSRFDVDLLRKMVSRGILLQLSVGRSERWRMSA